MYSNGGGAEIDPYKFTHELLKAAMNKGLRVYENTEVTNVKYKEDGVEVETRYDYKVRGEDINFIPDIYNEKEAEEKYSILEARLKTLFPKIKDIEVQYKYCEDFTSTQDNLGFIGKDSDNDRLWFDLGYGANGILFAILGGIMLSELYLEGKNEYLNLFRIDRFDN